MAQRVIPEWNGPELIYVKAGQAVLSFGYNMYIRDRTPKCYEYMENSLERAKEADGEVASQATEFPDASGAYDLVKEKAVALGADQVGVTHVDQYHVYKGQDVPHKYAVVVAVAMDYDAIKQTPTAASIEEVMRIYDATGSIATDLAKWIRSLGYPARAHTLRFEQLSMLPHAYAAGLGEMGKHGSLINREMGCSFRVAVVTTDMPLVEDSPLFAGIQDVCANCRMCVDYCPGDAISHQKQDVRGIEKWVVDTEACAPYWGSYYACGICLQVCPFNAKGFGGKFKQTFIQTIKDIDLKEWRSELEAWLQEPWTFVDPPTDFPEDWRNQLTGKTDSEHMEKARLSDVVIRTEVTESGQKQDAKTV